MPQAKQFLVNKLLAMESLELNMLLKELTNVVINDTHKEKAPSNKTSALLKSMNMNIWVVGTSNQLFIQGS